MIFLWVFMGRGNGAVWHYGSDDEGLDSKEIFMPPYYNSDDYV